MSGRIECQKCGGLRFHCACGTVGAPEKPKSCVDCEKFVLSETLGWSIWLGCKMYLWQEGCVKTEYWFRREIKRAETCPDFVSEVD